MQIAIAIVGGLAMLVFVSAFSSKDKDVMQPGSLFGALLALALYVLALVK